MCYGCRPTCDDCKPKFVWCAACGRKNFLFSDTCTGCGESISEERKEEARKAWKRAKDESASAFGEE